MDKLGKLASVDPAALQPAAANEETSFMSLSISELARKAESTTCEEHLEGIAVQTIFGALDALA